MDPKSGGWSEEEDRLLLEGYYKYGNAWTQIARHIGNRTDNAVKNRWSVLMKRRGNETRESSEPSEGSAGRGDESTTSQRARRTGKKQVEPYNEEEEDDELRLPKKPKLRVSVPRAPILLMCYMFLAPCVSM